MTRDLSEGIPVHGDKNTTRYCFLKTWETSSVQVCAFSIILIID